MRSDRTNWGATEGGSYVDAGRATDLVVLGDVAAPRLLVESAVAGRWVDFESSAASASVVVLVVRAGGAAGAIGTFGMDKLPLRARS